jgi:hypothetical protein
MSSINTYRAIARIFSRPVYRELAEGRIARPLEEALSQHALGLAATDETIGSIFERAYEHLTKNYRSEYVYKNTIVQKIVFGQYAPSTTAFFSEFNVGSSKADVVVLNGTSSVYEIKTQYDSFSRLATQLSDYCKVFDLITVVTHEAGAANAQKLAPDHVGILVLDRRGRLKKIRSAVSNIANVENDAMFKCLRRDEYQRILQRTCGNVPTASPSLFWQACRERFIGLPTAVAHMEMVSELRKRTTGRAKVDLVSSLPKSLRALGLAEPLSLARGKNLLENLSTPFCRLL